ncbi:MAG: chemotaxis protein CheC [Anaerolineales bacterium]|uniref:chemotaxis protein CheC n=1 Tax=Candidatus Villigracilis saccharophilus TaxID=3140684 RepID=UPI00313755C6|nr:chemotaxis protein CheC [Anaerolineales bacterium]MBK8422005.1 chemotaxis protein CheC [Anaerolineales bacterium]
MNDIAPFDQDLLEILKTIASEGIKNAAHGFSGMIGRKIEVSNPALRLVPLLTIPELVGGPEDDAVGIYLRFEGDMVGQIMMIMPYQKAMELVDLLMDIPQGTTQHLGSIERSALGELGNMCGTFFLNSLAKLVGASIKPTPPAVMVDMVGAILDIVVATSGGISDQILLMQANFMDGVRSVEANFWVIPDMNALQNLLKKNS